MKINFSLTALFVIVGIAAVFSLGLSQPETLWADMCVMVTLFTLAAIAARAFSSSIPAKRIAATAGAIFGISYFLIVMSGFFFHPLWDHLPTSKLLSLVYESANGPITAPPSPPSTVSDFIDSPSPQTMTDAAQFAKPLVSAAELAEPELPTWPNPAAFDLEGDLPERLIVFFQVGHCAFVILFALLGWGIARVGLARRREST